jgi:hypothetical protein
MRHKDSAMVVLSDEHLGGRITVDMEAFFDFNFAISEELEVLVGNWEQLAAPLDIAECRLDRENRSVGDR